MSVLDALMQYVALRRALGTQLQEPAMTLGVRASTGSRRIGRGPRLQDFRHSFATRRLIEWYRAGLDVERELPKLATYLGHVDVAHTYWYIQAVPELLKLAAERLDGRRPGGER